MSDYVYVSTFWVVCLNLCPVSSEAASHLNACFFCQAYFALSG